jgi:hypothetical protein
MSLRKWGLSGRCGFHLPGRVSDFLSSLDPTYTVLNTSIVEGCRHLIDLE